MPGQRGCGVAPAPPATGQALAVTSARSGRAEVTRKRSGAASSRRSLDAGTVQATISTGDEPAAETAWVVGTPWQGLGIATEAALALVAWLGRRSVKSVVAHIHPDHQASAAVAVAAGLTPTGQLRDGEMTWHLTMTLEMPGTAPVDSPVTGESSIEA